MIQKTILTVDDEEHILELIKYNLENAGYHVITAETGKEALEKLEHNNIDLALLDLMLPGMDGIDILKEIRSHNRYNKLPVIILTAKSDEISRVIGLEIGADDYISKPFGVHELIARIKAIFRRTEGSLSSGESNVKNNEEEMVVDHININKTRRRVTLDGKLIELSLKEFELLYFLVENRGIVFTRETLLERIWGYDYSGETRTVDVHVSNIRKKLGEDEKDSKYIKTIRGVGYKFNN